MDALWQWIGSVAVGLDATLIGYIFNRTLKFRDTVAEQRSQLAKAGADLAGMTTAYNRERERVSDMEAVERDAKNAAMIGQAVARALGKLPAETET
jgi:hypothetical protein